MHAIGRYAVTFLQGRMPFYHACISLVLTYLLFRSLSELSWLGWSVTVIVALLGAMIGLGIVRKVMRLLQESAGTPGAVVLSIGCVALSISALVMIVDNLTPNVPAISAYVPPKPKVFLRDNVFELEGSIDYRMLSDLKDLKTRHASVDLIRLNSEGGNVRAGRALGLFITQAGLNTRVDGKCFSACTLAFAGGILRDLGPDGQLGFHGYRKDSRWRPSTQNIEEVQEKDSAFLQSRGIARAFISRIYTTPPSDMWMPDRSDLISAGVVKR